MSTNVMQRPAEMEHAAEPTVFTLQPGPRWKSFDQLRLDGPAGLLEKLPEGYLGRVQVKDTEYIIVRSLTFNRVYGLARDVSRLTRGLLLVRQAARVFLHINRNDMEGIKVAGELLHELTYQLPDLPTELAPTRDLAFSDGEDAQIAEDDLDFEVGPMHSTHPSFATAE